VPCTEAANQGTLCSGPRRILIISRNWNAVLHVSSYGLGWRVNDYTDRISVMVLDGQHTNLDMLKKLVHAAILKPWYYGRCDDRVLPGLVAHGHHNCIKCTKADARLRTPHTIVKKLCQHFCGGVDHNGVFFKRRTRDFHNEPEALISC
jgi:hypothetical protein